MQNTVHLRYTYNIRYIQYTEYELNVCHGKERNCYCTDEERIKIDCDAVTKRSSNKVK